MTPSRLDSHAFFRRAGVLACACLAFAAPSLGAQDRPRDIHGQVKDQHHEPLKGAIVYLENENTQAVATFVTDRSGGYEFKHVNSSENYMLWASYRGTASKKKLISRFDSKQEKNISFVLRLR